VKAAALVAAAAYAFPWSKTHAKEDELELLSELSEDGKFWVAELGEINEFNGPEPCFVNAKFKDNKGELVDDSKVYVRWEQRGKMHTDGRAIVISALCTHLKCKVEFKSDEGIFRCPCHKSEFERDGTVKKKPAKKDLPDFSDMVKVDGEMLYLRKRPD
jgi:Rieske Fe-S protein